MACEIKIALGWRSRGEEGDHAVLVANRIMALGPRVGSIEGVGGGSQNEAGSPAWHWCKGCVMQCTQCRRSTQLQK